jgi:hypothetical protein
MDSADRKSEATLMQLASLLTWIAVRQDTRLNNQKATYLVGAACGYENRFPNLLIDHVWHYPVFFTKPLQIRWAKIVVLAMNWIVKGTFVEISNVSPNLVGIGTLKYMPKHCASWTVLYSPPPVPIRV